ncbi:hypothetical protein [Demequina sediminicola]|uniref:hypothetical protein n=1 Tax=Demequina sediminicola TaxID=1095026 RepID=UPI0007852A21|nr:hypothetical protein [Demequina sediminicola]
MTTYSYPGSFFPGPPQVSIAAAEGWEAKAGLGPAMTFTHESGAKLEVLVTRVRPEETLEDAAAQITTTFTKLPGFSETVRSDEDIAGHPGFTLEAKVKHPVTRKGYCQFVRYLWVEQSGGTRDLVQLMGTCPAAMEDDRAPEIRAMQESVEIAV